MHKIAIIVPCSVALILVAVLSSAWGQQEASPERGKALLSDPRLGTNGRTCSECHLDGKGLERAGTKKDIEQIVNGCIARALNGKPLAADSVEMRSIVLYLKSLSGKTTGR